MYDDIADAMYGLVKRIKTDVTVPDKIVYIMFHEDTDDFGISRLRTIGKQLDRESVPGRHGHDLHPVHE